MLHECYMVFRSHKNRSATTTSQHQKQSFANSPIQVEIVIKIDHSIHNHKIPTNDAAYKYKMEERDRRKQMINEKFSIIIWQFIFGWKNFFIFSRIEAFGKKICYFPTEQCETFGFDGVKQAQIGREQETKRDEKGWLAKRYTQNKTKGAKKYKYKNEIIYMITMFLSP